MVGDPTLENSRFNFGERGRAAVWEWAQVALLVANLAWTTYCLGGYRPETMVGSSALTGALLAVHLLGRGWSAWSSTRSDATLFRFHPAGWWFVPFLVYAAANVAWVSPVPWIGWRDWLGWAQMIAVFWVVLNGVRSRDARAALFWSLVAIGFVAVLFACYQRFVKPDWLAMGRTQANQFIGRASGPFGIPNSLAALLLLLLPPMIGLVFQRGASAVQRVLGGYLALVFAFGIFLTISRGAWLALVLVAVAWPVFARRGAWWRRLTWAAVAMAALGGTVATLFWTVPRVRDRLTSLQLDEGERTRPIMWRGAWKIFEEHPVWGSGGGSYNVVFEKHRPARFQDEPVWTHNDYLNTLSDYGAVGFGLFFGACAAVGVGVWRSARRRRLADVGAAETGGWWGARSAPRLPLDRLGALRAPNGQAGSYLCAGMAAFALQLGVDFHLKIPALAMAFAMVAALAVQEFWPVIAEAEGGARNARRFGCAVGSIAVLAGVIFFAAPVYRAEALRYGARQEMDRMAVRQLPESEWPPVLSWLRADLQRAVEIDPANGRAWAEYSYANALWARAEPANAARHGAEALRAADRALACSAVVPEFWLRRGVALNVLGRRVEAGGAFVEALKLAPANAVAWYYHAVHLSLDRAEAGRARAAVDFALRLDPQNGDAQALRRRLTERGRSP